MGQPEGDNQDGFGGNAWIKIVGPTRQMYERVGQRTGWGVGEGGVVSRRGGSRSAGLEGKTQTGAVEG